MKKIHGRIGGKEGEANVINEWKWAFISYYHWQRPAGNLNFAYQHLYRAHFTSFSDRQYILQGNACCLFGLKEGKKWPQIKMTRGKTGIGSTLTNGLPLRELTPTLWTQINRQINIILFGCNCNHLAFFKCTQHKEQ